MTNDSSALDLINMESSLHAWANNHITAKIIIKNRNLVDDSTSRSAAFKCRSHALSLFLLGTLMFWLLSIVFLPIVFPEGTSGCLRSTRRLCTSGTQTSALKERTIFQYPFTGKEGIIVSVVLQVV